MSLSDARTTPIDILISIVAYKPDIKKLTQTLKSITTPNSQLNIKTVISDNSPSSHISELQACPGQFEYKYNGGDNLGFGRAHNSVIEEHAGQAKYVLVLNPDIYFEPELLPKIFHRMECNPEIGLSIPKICYPSGHTQPVNRRLPTPYDMLLNYISARSNDLFANTRSLLKYHAKDLDTTKPYFCPFISGCFMFFRTSVLEQVGLFDERYFLYLEDIDLSRRAAETSLNVVFSDLLAYHHWNRGSHTSYKLFWKQVTSALRYFSKWGWVYDAKRTHLNNLTTAVDLTTTSASGVAPVSYQAIPSKLAQAQIDTPV